MPDASTSTSLFPVLSAFGGYLIGAGTEYLRDRRIRAREREARAEARRLQLFQRRSNFQRETLLNLQDAIFALARASSRVHHLDEKEFRESGVWHRNRLPEDLDEEGREAVVKTTTYMVRVRDDGIRELTRTFRDNAARLGICRSIEESRQAAEAMAAAVSPLHERIGLVLRKLDDDEDNIELKQ